MVWRGPARSGGQDVSMKPVWLAAVLAAGAVGCGSLKSAATSDVCDKVKNDLMQLRNPPPTTKKEIVDRIGSITRDIKSDTLDAKNRKLRDAGEKAADGLRKLGDSLAKNQRPDLGALTGELRSAGQTFKELCPDLEP